MFGTKCDKALLQSTLPLLCSSQLVKPANVFLIPFEHLLLLKVCRSLLLFSYSVSNSASSTLNWC